MKRRDRKLTLHRETVLQLNLVIGGERPSEHGSNCNSCYTIVQPVTELDCASGTCATGVFSQCANLCSQGCTIAC